MICINLFYLLGAKLAEELQTLTKSDIMEFFKRYFHPESPTRTNLSIQFQGRLLDKFAFELLLSAMEKHGIAVPTSMKEYIDDKPMYKESRDKLMNEFLPLFDISDEMVKNEIIDRIEDIAGFKAPSGEKVVESLDEIRATGKLAPPVSPGKHLSFRFSVFSLDPIVVFPDFNETFFNSGRL